MIDWIETYIGRKQFLLLVGIVIVIAGFQFGPKLYEQTKMAEYNSSSEAVVASMS